MSICDQCVHYPICEWVGEHYEQFKFPAGEDVMACEVFLAKEEKVCTCEAAKNTAFDHTIEMMRSPDYKERFKAEYLQAKIRYERLKAFNTRIEAGERFCFGGGKTVEAPKHDCPFELLMEQQHIMGQYLHILEVRAVIEGINLNN